MTKQQWERQLQAQPIHAAIANQGDVLSYNQGNAAWMSTGAIPGSRAYTLSELVN
jgi:hypothetical protein